MELPILCYVIAGLVIVLCTSFECDRRGFDFSTIDTIVSLFFLATIWPLVIIMWVLYKLTQENQ